METERQLSRRELLLHGVRGVTALGLAGCANEYDLSPQSEQTHLVSAPTTPKQFNELTANESLVGQQFILRNINGTREEISVEMSDLFHWKINGNRLTVIGVGANGQQAHPDDAIGPMNQTVRQCVEDCIVSEGNTGVTIQTVYGSAHVSNEQFAFVVSSLAERDEGLKQGMHYSVKADIAPNEDGQRLLNVGKAWNGLKGMFGGEVEEVTLPNKVTIGFQEEGQEKLRVAHRK